MIIRDPRELKRLERVRLQPCLPRTTFSSAKVLAGVRAQYFGDLDSPVDLYFVPCGPLACITMGMPSPTIYVHEVLNHPETPLEVMTLICKHELLHLRMPPREFNGRVTDHPPEFWQEEARMAPERAEAWAWVWENLWGCLKRRPKLERIDVLPEWSRAWQASKLTIQECMANRKLRAVDMPETAGW